MIDIYPDKPIVIAGPTASGKSALALYLAETQGGVVVNADALQVFDGWRLLTARPPDEDLARARHLLYGHVPDLQNRVRVQRAWEVQRSTGRSLAAWQDDTPPAVLPRTDATCIVMDAPKDWLTPRIRQRFDLMLDAGALSEAEAMLPRWDPAHLSSKAIGAPELIAHLQGQLSLADATERAVIASTQYAKRQRTWFRKRMRDWNVIQASSTDLSTAFTFHT